MGNPTDIHFGGELSDSASAAAEALGNAGVTATSGLGAAVLEPSYSITNNELSTVPAGSLVRAGGLLAQGDTYAHLSGLLGVTVAGIAASATGKIQPLRGLASVRFDAAPTAGSPCFVSASVAGAATCTIPWCMIPSYHLGTVVSDTSVGVAYSGIIAFDAVGLASPSLRDRLLEETRFLLGDPVANGRWVHSFYDYDDMNSTNYAPPFGSLVGTASRANGTKSAMHLVHNAVFTVADPILPKYTATGGIKFRWTGRVKLPFGNYRSWAMRMQQVDAGAPNRLMIGFVCYGGIDGTKLYHVHGNWPEFDAGNDFTVGTGCSEASTEAESTWHVFDQIAFGNGNISWRIDGGAWATPFAPNCDWPTSNTSFSPLRNANVAGSESEVDWHFWAAHQ